VGGLSSNTVSRSAVWHEVWIFCGPQELQGDGYDLVTGLALRSTRPLDTVLADSRVWQVEIRQGGA
jgi:hypothetical protein